MMVDRVVHLDDSQQCLIAVAASMGVDNCNLFITHACWEDILMRDSLVDFLAPGVDGWYVAAL